MNAARPLHSRASTASRSKRARRFWASMGAVLRQSSPAFAACTGDLRRAAAIRVTHGDPRQWRR